ncbi:enoyl-CoA hydratase-related protein [Schleiferia thermophila]|jgi:2-(1,2-epoxy-1,2-dihydrophenyl)acetyl-CoA isomerase|uniref:2-(1,2-epoxy-1,2-dihydrophenyl)acetyl-CoA isomerase n=1 Tax=Schleiferia thermophila TaxID=884107 RepID=A0A369A737_9FLAO|nr:enoyl-CoA hydratase-related protein [Schleiferia thermophila]KFD38312.1 enoyl-CoA hydratase [Schleiferia thermophila str. Yellowstone]RCX05099.1 2-(1,2-epoxy-1,2-dihydrophenyl)acetyl-CoA isomerase [Schleiferia thermophila]GCD79384.1 2-(1,2-epoxy-1,2-dihydrophenyl)acetyl-CoA isomerase [Schleiferia thermophila]
MSDFIQSELQNQVLNIYFNRPDKYNAFVREMALAFQAELDRASEDDNIRAVYVSGRGRAFCAGQDLAEAVDPNGPELSRIVSEHYNPIILKIRRCPKPIVMAVNGVAAGAGANIALAGDVVVAARSASFIQAFSKIGLIPDSGGTYTLPRLIGFGKASALMMLGDRVSADEASALGMIYKVLDDEVFEKESLAIAQTLSQMPTKALALTKKALNKSFSNDLVTQLHLEDELQTQAGNSLDYQEGVKAFLEKRKPEFTGK